MERTTLATAEGYLQWQSSDALHTDRQYFNKLDFWRDILPGNLGNQMLDGGPGVGAEVQISPGELIPPANPKAVRSVDKRAVCSAFRQRRIAGPYHGRFYPRGLLAGSTGFDGIFKQDLHPFRVAAVDTDTIDVDLNHPLSTYSLKMGARIDEYLKSREERGGHCNDLLADLSASGSGMQCRPETGTVSFIHHRAFNRADGSDDADFYRTPRLVHHIDARARTQINQIYRRFITGNMRVLDLMSSWASHLDGVSDSVEITGLGMNAAELNANPQLAESVLHDLNKDPSLPFPDTSFDVAVCSVSVEYLVRPFETFSEVARVLKPGGYFIVTFSDRWFPPKAIQLWAELHPFERMGLVLEYFRRADRFGALTTESYRGWPRPSDDKYYPQRWLADPVFAVWGQLTASN